MFTVVVSLRSPEQLGCRRAEDKLELPRVMGLQALGMEGTRAASGTFASMLKPLGKKVLEGKYDGGREMAQKYKFAKYMNRQFTEKKPN